MSINNCSVVDGLFQTLDSFFINSTRYPYHLALVIAHESHPPAIRCWPYRQVRVFDARVRFRAQSAAVVSPAHVGPYVHGRLGHRSRAGLVALLMLRYRFRLLCMCFNISQFLADLYQLLFKVVMLQECISLLYQRRFLLHPPAVFATSATEGCSTGVGELTLPA